MFSKITSAVVLILMSASVALAADRVQFDAMLIRASNEPARPDRRLADVESQLRSNVKFSSLRLEGSGGAEVNLPDDCSIDLGGGNMLRVNAARADGKVRADVRWMRAGREVIHSAVKMTPGTHAIFGGVNAGDGKLLVTLRYR